MGLYLVTGGAGFIGSSIAQALLAKGETVRILDDFSSGRRENVAGLPGRVELVEGTIVDPATVARAVAGVEVIFHEAAIPSVARSVENPQATMLAGVHGTTVVLDLARRAGVRRVVFAGSASAYGDAATLPKVETMASRPLSPYAASKVTGEHPRWYPDLLPRPSARSARSSSATGSRRVTSATSTTSSRRISLRPAPHTSSVARWSISRAECGRR